MYPPNPVPTPGSQLFASPRNIGQQAISETSSGGVVLDTIDGTLCAAIIARPAKMSRVDWCLPKGHVEHNETIHEAAQREVAEETGLDAKILRPIGIIDYWFHRGSFRVHKTVHHFLMQRVGGTLSIEHDPDQEASDAAWRPVLELPGVLAFSNERKIAQKALDYVHQIP